jgi:spore germination protein YaaH
LALLGVCLTGCGWWSGETVDKVGQGDGAAIPDRYASVVSDGCTPDAWQASVLGSAAAKRIVKEVILLCAVPRFAGGVGPQDPSARQELLAVANLLHGEGYKVKLGVSFTNETSERYDGAQTAKLLSDSLWRTTTIRDLAVLVRGLDGVEIDMQKLSGFDAPSVSAFFKELSGQVRPAEEVALLAPPATAGDPVDGPAFDLPTLSQWLDRVRVMTLDYSTDVPGPTIDPGWAVDALRFTKSQVGAVPLDVAMPLYGNDWSSYGTRNVTWFEARALADEYKIGPTPGPTGALHFKYTDASGTAHEIWYDDTTSTLRTLRAWGPDVLPGNVGVVFYGLGAEDPALWGAMAGALQ